LLRSLLSRSVFFGVGRDRWRFSHREWQDYLASHFMANACADWQFQFITQRALTKAMFAMSGDILIEMLPDRAFHDKFFDRALELGRLAVTNLAGLIGSSRIALPPRGLRHMLSLPVLEELDPTARLVIFTAVGSRAIENHKE